MVPSSSILQVALLEVLNAIRFNPKADEETGEPALEALQDLHLESKTAHVDLLRKANAIAWAYKTTIYDALYVALAEQVGYPVYHCRRGNGKEAKGSQYCDPLA